MDNKEDLQTIRVTFNDGTIYSCHISRYRIICYDNITCLFAEEWYADGRKRELNIPLDKIKMFTIE